MAASTAARPTPLLDPFDRAMLVLDAAYPRKDQTLTPELLRVYRVSLADIPGDHLELAALRHIAASKFFPTVAELREAVAATLTREERETLADLHRLRGWLAAGMIPATWGPTRLIRTRAALGLPPPTAGDLDRLARDRALAKLPPDDPDDAPCGPADAYLRAHGGAATGLLALVAGGRP